MGLEICVAEFKLLRRIAARTMPAEARFASDPGKWTCRLELWSPPHVQVPALGWLTFGSEHPLGDLETDQPIQLYDAVDQLGQATVKIWPVAEEDILDISSARSPVGLAELVLSLCGPRR